MTRTAKKRINKGRILLLEDHAALASLRRDFLDGQGYQVICSGSGEEAMRLLESQPFQLVVADALLSPAKQRVKVGSKREAKRKDGTGRGGENPAASPAMSGWEVAAVAKQLGVPVILSSGWPVRLGARELRNLGIGYLCPKPCSLHQLLGMIERVMEGAPARRVAARPQLRQPRIPGTKGSVPKPRTPK